MATLDRRADEQAFAWGLFSYHQRWLLGDMVIVPVCSGPDRRVDSVWETVRPEN